MEFFKNSQNDIFLDYSSVQLECSNRIKSPWIILIILEDLKIVKKNLLSITNNWKIAANVDANLPNVKPCNERFFSVFYENSKQKLPKKQTTEKITVEIDAKICFGKKYKISKNW